MSANLTRLTIPVTSFFATQLTLYEFSYQSLWGHFGSTQ